MPAPAADTMTVSELAVAFGITHKDVSRALAEAKMHPLSVVHHVGQYDAEEALRMVANWIEIQKDRNG